MELKTYQRKVIDNLTNFLEVLQTAPTVSAAYKVYWEQQNVPINAIDGMKPYTNILGEVPHVCFKVPTGGGKTFLACNALYPIFNSFPYTQTKVVVWLVPSDAILQQTVKNLSDPDHPYRHKINVDFSNRVEVYAKSQLLTGQNFNPTSVQEQLSILVLSYDSFRTRNQDGRKSYQENGNLAQFARIFGKAAHPIDGADETSLIQVVNQLNPVVIVDESHHATSDLSVAMLKNFNPKFVLDLTATPKKDSNIISFVDAAELKSANMVKLPVMVYNRPNKEDVVGDAIAFRNRLERMAQEEQSITGCYIRPIVLFQAQPRNDADSTTYDKIKENLLAAGIPADEIAIKVDSKDDLKKVDLMSEHCPIRYIITVNALKEGWDCPFAYILATIANKSSAVDVEQIVGRILRQPYTRQHENKLLNYAYVFTCSNQFSDTVNKVVDGLNNAGFGKWDCCAAEELPQKTAESGGAIQIQPELDLTTDEIDDSTFNPDAIRDRINADYSGNDDITNAIEQSAIEQGDDYTEALNKSIQQGNNAAPAEVKSKMKNYRIKSAFADTVKDIEVPQFFLRQPPSLFAAEELCLLDKKHLSRGFSLKSKDIEISWEQSLPDAYAVDVTGIGREQKAERKQLNENERRKFMEYLNSQPTESRIRLCTNAIIAQLNKYDEVESSELTEYVQRVIANLSSDQLAALETDYYVYAQKIKEKIDCLLAIHREKLFFEWKQLDKIVVKPSWHFAREISPMQTSSSIAKSLYESEGSMNTLETKLADKLSSLPNIVWWHRNIDRNGFYINGFINHYPDFIAMSSSGRLILIETKGEQLKNDDSDAKVRLGKAWEHVAGSQFKYLMVFEKYPLKEDGAYNFSDFSRIIQEL